MAKDKFGEIKIDRGSPAPEDTPDVPLSPADGESGNHEAKPVTVVHDPPETYRSRRSDSFIPGVKFPVPSKKTVAWLLTIPLAVILYGVGSYFLVPASIKGILIPQVSRDIDRPINVGRIVYSPFNLEIIIDDIRVGPIFGDVSGKDLLTSGNARLLLSLRDILQGKLLCRKAVVDILSMNLVRGKDSTIDLNTIVGIFHGGTADGGEGFFPSWLIVDEVEINADQLVVDDQLTGKVFNLEQIYFYLPSAEKRFHETTAVPKLSAVIDSSPFEINAVRIKNQTGSWSTGFSFEFRSVLLQRFRELLPFPDSGLELSDGEADMVVDFILPEIQEESEGIVVEGETSLKNIQWFDPESGAIFKLPEGKVIYKIVPAEKLYRFVNVEFQGMEIILKGNPKISPQSYILSVIQKIFHSDETFEVESFLVNNGKILLQSDRRSDKAPALEDVRITLNSFSTAALRTEESSPQPSKYTFNAKDHFSDPVAELMAEGELTADATLKGQLKVTGLNVERFSTVFPALEFKLDKGKADFSMLYEYQGSPVQEQNEKKIFNKIYDGSFTISDFTLSRKKKGAVSGNRITCKKFHFDTVNLKVVCDHLQLSKAKIDVSRILSSKLNGQNKEQKAWGFTTANLTIAQGALDIPLKYNDRETGKATTSTFPVKKVMLEVSGLQSEKVNNNVKMSGSVGINGHVKVNGSYSRVTGQGDLQLSIDQIEISHFKPYYASWFTPTFKNGFLSANGKVQLPQKTFTGAAWLDEFDAAGTGGSTLKWKRLRADNITYTSDPVSVRVSDLLLKEPMVEPGLSSGDTPFTNFLSLKEGKLPDSIQFAKIRIEDGTVDLPEPVLFPGYQPRVTDISGTVSFANADKQSFMLNGKIGDQSSFIVYGTGTMKGLQMYELEMKDFSLLPFDTILKKDVGFSGKGVVASWKQKKGILENKAISETNITLKNVVPAGDDPAHTALSMFIDKDQKIEMRFKGESAGSNDESFLIEQFVNSLRHYGVKAAISPELVLKTAVPSLNIPQQISFNHGEAQLDETIQLSSYQELFQLRPFLKLIVKGGYDPSADREILQERLQKQEDERREIENKRRALEKVRILQEEQRRKRELKSPGSGGVVEEVIPGYSKKDLEPLPPVMVVLPESQLAGLAKERARKVYDHLVNQLRIDPTRVTLDDNIAKSGATVFLQVRSYKPPGISR